MILVRVFTAAFEILRSMDGDIVEVGTLAASSFTFEFSTFGLKVVMGLIKVVTETFRGGAYDFTGESLRIVPGCIHSIGYHLWIVLLVLGELFLAHHFAPIVSYQLAVFQIGLHVFFTS